MKPDFKNKTKLFLKLLVTVFLAKILAFVIELYTPSLPQNQKPSFNSHPVAVMVRLEKAFGINQNKTSKTEVKSSQSFSMEQFILKGLYGNDKKGFIIIAQKSNPTNTEIVSLGDVYNGYKLVAIKTNYVMFQKNNKDYKLELNETKEIFKSPKVNIKQIDQEEKDNFTLTKSQIKSFIADPSKIWRNIKINDYKVDGELKGFKVEWIKKGSFFEKLGVKKGDVIIRANNMELTSYKAVMDLYAKWQKMDMISIVVLRDNEQKELFYEID
jgi:general secretion pathway protein C